MYIAILGLLVDLVPMLEQQQQKKKKTKKNNNNNNNKKKKKKKDEKGYFFQAGQCAALSSFRVRKWHFSWKRVGFLKSDKKKKNAVIRSK